MIRHGRLGVAEGLKSGVGFTLLGRLRWSGKADLIWAWLVVCCSKSR